MSGDETVSWTNHVHQLERQASQKDADCRTEIAKVVETKDAEIAALRERLAEVEAERDRCHARLEIDHAFVLRNDDLERFEIPMDERASFPDAVDARDATIKLVEERAEAAEARVKQIRAETIEDVLAVYDECAGVAVLGRDNPYEQVEAYRATIRLLKWRAARALADANTGKGGDNG